VTAHNNQHIFPNDNDVIDTAITKDTSLMATMLRVMSTLNPSKLNSAATQQYKRVTVVK